MRESQIIEQFGDFWIADADGQYSVYVDRPNGLYAKADSSYPRTPDGLSIAKARLAYLAKREELRNEIANSGDC